MSRESTIPWKQTNDVQESIAHSNAVIPLVALALTVATSIMFGMQVSAWGLLLAMSGSFLIYVVERTWLAGPEDQYSRPDRVDWLVNRRLGLSVVTGVVALAFAASVLRTVTLNSLPTIGWLCLAAGMYCVPILPGRERLKSIWYLKPVLIATAWSLGTVVLPIVLAGRSVTGAVLAVFLYRFLFLLPNTLLADVPDVDGDRLAGLSTAAMRLGPRVLHVSATIAALLPAFAIVIWLLVPVSALILVDSLVGPLLSFVLWRARPLPRVFYILHIDLLVALPLIGATLFGLAT